MTFKNVRNSNPCSVIKKITGHIPSIYQKVLNTQIAENDQAEIILYHHLQSIILTFRRSWPKFLHCSQFLNNN